MKCKFERTTGGWLTGWLDFSTTKESCIEKRNCCLVFCCCLYAVSMIGSHLMVVCGCIHFSIIFVVVFFFLFFSCCWVLNADDNVAMTAITTFRTMVIKKNLTSQPSRSSSSSSFVTKCLRAFMMANIILCVCSLLLSVLLLLFIVAYAIFRNSRKTHYDSLKTRRHHKN